VCPSDFVQKSKTIDKITTINSEWNIQAKSPLFNKIPAEIRDRIFSFALTAFDDHDHPYKPGQHWYRPGYHYPLIIDLRLLQTCKRIYHEYRLLPVMLNEFVFYVLDGPSYPTIDNQLPANLARPDGVVRMYSLTKEQQRSIQNIHYFVQQSYLEDWIYWGVWLGRFFAKRLTLTLRRTDWWFWESDEASIDRLGICPWLSGRTTCQMMEAEPLDPTLDYITSKMAQGGITWARLIQRLTKLEVLEIEFETEAKKKDQLDTVVDRAKRWKFPREAGTHLCWTGDIRETLWEGLIHPKTPEHAEPPTLTHVVAVLTFRLVKS